MPFWIGYTGIRGEDVGAEPDYAFALPDGSTNRVRLNQLPKVMTANKGAAEIRSKILRKMRELEGDTMHHNADKWSELRAYIKGMAKRASSKKGGLGRK